MCFAIYEHTLAHLNGVDTGHSGPEVHGLLTRGFSIGGDGVVHTVRKIAPRPTTERS
jgi:hypothetical protein